MTEAVQDKPHALRSAHQMLDYLAGSFHFLPLPPAEDRHPKQEEWGSFIVKHPQYADNDSRYQVAAELFADSGESTDELSPELQALAGGLIAVTFSQEELMGMALGD